MKPSSLFLIQQTNKGATDETGGYQVVEVVGVLAESALEGGFSFGGHRPRLLSRDLQRRPCAKLKWVRDDLRDSLLY